MRPLTLELEGFTSFRDRTLVDFRDLDLVAFVGPTGSGKSSIIDAMTFALYGSVARYRDEKQVSAAVNTLANEAKVSLVFEAGGHEYTVTRIVRRDKKGGASTKEARLESGGEVIAGSVSELNDAIVRLLGLKFDEFTKTVVLPQGEFARFLHDTPAKRQELLRRVMSLEVYQAMASMARRRSDEAKNTSGLLAGQLADEPDVTNAAVDEAERLVKTRHNVRDRIRPVLDEIAATEAAIDKLDVEAGEDDRALDLLSRLQEPDDLDEVGYAVAEVDSRLAALEGALAVAEKAVIAAREAVNQGPSKPELLALKASIESLAAEAASLESAEQVVTSSAADADATRRQLDEIEDLLDQLRAEVDAAAADLLPLQQRLDELPKRTDIERALERRAKVAELQAQLDEKGQAIETKQAELVEALSEQERTAHLWAEAEKAYTAAQARAGAAAVAAGLNPGESCPVCGGIFHELADHTGTEVLRVAAAELTESRDLAEEAALVVSKLGTEVKVLKQSASDLEIRVAEETREVGASEAELRSSLAAVEVAISAFEAKQTQHRDLVATLQQHERSEAVAAARRTAAEAITKFELAAERRNDLARRCEQLAQQIGLAELDQVEAALATADDLAQALKEAEGAESKLRLERHAAVAARDAARKRSDAFESQFERARDTVGALSPPTRTRGGIVEEWRALIDWRNSVTAEVEQRRVDRAAKRSELVGFLCGRRSSASQMLADAGIAPDEGQSIDVAVEAAVGEASRLAESLAEVHERRSKLKEQQKAADETAAIYSTLARHLGKGQFEAWLLEEVLASLTDLATERLFQLSGGQYSLEVDGTEFQVRDHRNADERRDAKTLSGGETFLASLSLALALGDSVREMAQDGSTEIESIFLDEGFGTLDADTLDTVATAIEELGSSGRMVGLVTHIRELADRVPARFEVARNATTSTVTRVEA